MFSKVKGFGLQGDDRYIVEAETDIINGMPGFEKVGYIIKK